MDTLPVVELFGPTIQGEGPLIGVQTHFVRFGFCDFKCGWCDSMHAVDSTRVKADARQLTSSQIVCEVAERGNRTPWVTLSGGNPAIHRGVGVVVRQLQEHGFRVAVETQGTVFQEWLRECDLVTISPKPPSAGQGNTLGKLREFMLQLAQTKVPKIAIKVPVFDEEDYSFAVEVYNRWYKGTTLEGFFLSTGNHTPGKVGDDATLDLLAATKWLTELTLSRGSMPHARILPQLHVLLWGNELAR